ncbi:MAG: prolyl-tRNA synthetase associated domain-containing protein [Clostridiales bacterium]|nr:prolyl-tRNA synthetase associated domain-containing protein [Clostridiales bacterium]
MTLERAEVLAHLERLGIEYSLFEHPPARTIDDCRASEIALCAVMPRNLFLTPRNASAHYLLIARPSAPFRTAQVSRQIPSSRLSFAGEDDLYRLLRTRPGAIGPLGLIYDRDRAVRLLVDRGLQSAPRLAFHPCDSEASVGLSGDDFFGAFLPSLGRKPQWIDLSE